MNHEMIANILKPSGSMGNVLDYNERKVDQGVAMVLAAVNIPSSSPEDIEKTFSMYERRNIKTQKMTFHMNIDPLEGQDNMTSDDVVRLARKMMEGLGYGRQPYVIYRHNDIGREHYHVISIRTDRNGKKISDKFEGKRCYELLTLYQREFGYTVGNGNVRKADEPKLVFDPDSPDVSLQMMAIFDNCLKYNFTSVAQFILILRRFHIGAAIQKGKTDEFVLYGLNSRMNICTRKMLEGQIGRDLYREYEKRALECTGRMAVMDRERTRIINCARGPLKDATSELHFINMMRKNSIDVLIHREPTRERRITGATLVDHQSKCAFKLSDFGSKLSLDMLLNADTGWPHRHQSSRHSRAANRAVNLAGEMLLGMMSGDGSRSRGHDQKDETELEREERLEQQSL